MIELIKCDVCGGSIASDAKACPHCGHPNSHDVIVKRTPVKQVLGNFKPFLKGAFIFKDGKCPSFAQFVVQSVGTILLHVVLTVAVGLIGGAAEEYLPEPFNIIVVIPLFLLAIGQLLIAFRIILVFFPTIGKYERYIAENGLQDDSVYKQFVLHKNKCRMLYWGFFICLFLVWLLIVHIANDGDWRWVTEGGGYHPRRHRF